MSDKWRARAHVLVLVATEVVVLVALLRTGAALGSVPVAHMAKWLRAATPVEVFTALARLLGIGVDGWLLLSTAAYGLAAATGAARLLRVSRTLTLPAIRRVLDGLAGATIVASSVAAMAGGASASVLVRPAATVSHPNVPGSSKSPSVPRAPRSGRHIPHPGDLAHEPPERPTAAAHLAAPTPANGFAGLSPGTKVVVVQPGDCLSIIAERHLGDWRLDHEIEELNLGRPQADGLTLEDEHWIYPGWVLVMPPDAVGAITVGGQAPATPQTKAAGTPREMKVPKRTTVAHHRVTASEGDKAPAQRQKPKPPAPHREVKVHVASVAHKAQNQEAVRTRAPSRREDEKTIVAALGAGALAAGAIVWKLGSVRRERAHSRPKGHVPAATSPRVQAAERRARAISHGDALRWVDNALRYLGSLVELRALEAAPPLPAVTGLKVGRRGLEVTLAGKVNERVGWFDPADDGRVLRLGPELTLAELEVLAADRWNAWPAMVSVGEVDGMMVLVNLEHLGSLSVQGPNESVRGMLAGMALQLVTQPWSEEMIAAVHVMGENPLVNRTGLRQVSGADVMDLAEKLDGLSTARQQVAEGLSLSTLRAVASEALPEIVIAFAGSDRQAARCVAEASIPDTSGVALVVSGPCPQARWRLAVQADGKALLEGDGNDHDQPLELEVSFQTEEVVLLSEALDAAGETVPEGAGGPGGPGAQLIGRVDISSAAAEAETSGRVPALPEPGVVEISFLGPVDLVGADPATARMDRRTAALALICYVATRDGRLVTGDELLNALWPLDASKENANGAQRKTLMNVISRARALLGYGPGGKERIIYSARGYRLSEEVTSDWGRFSRLVAMARAQSKPDAVRTLRTALELVRGEAFNGLTSSHFFEWVASEHLDFIIAAKVVDAAQELGELALEAGDLECAAWAVEKGLKLEPTREELFRLWMHAFGRAGRPARVDDVYRRLKLVLRQRLHPLAEPQPETRDVWKKYTTVELATSWD